MSLRCETDNSLPGDPISGGAGVAVYITRWLNPMLSRLALKLATTNAVNMMDFSYMHFRMQTLDTATVI